MMLLEIVIPSFNGALHLEKTLKSLEVFQSKVKINDVKFKLYLNGSTDNSIDIAVRYKSLIANFDFVHFPDNQGYDKNLARALMLSSATYTLFLGDDDLILDNFYSIVEELRNSKHKWGLVHLNHIFIYHEEFSEIYTPTNSGTQIVTQSPKIFLRKHGTLAASLSTNIFLTSTIQNIPLHEFMDLDWLHLALVYKIVAEPGHKLGFFNDVTIAVRRGNPRWNDNFGETALVALNHLIVYRKILKKLHRVEYQMFRQDRFRLVRYNFLNQNFTVRSIYALKCLREFKVYPISYLDFMLKLSPPRLSIKIVKFLSQVKQSIN